MGLVADPVIELGTLLLEGDYTLVVTKSKVVETGILVDLWDAGVPSLVFSTVIGDDPHTLSPEEWL